MQYSRKRKEASPKPAPSAERRQADSQRSPLSDVANAMDWTPMPAKRPQAKLAHKRKMAKSSPLSAAFTSPEAMEARLREQMAMFEEIDNHVRTSGTVVQKTHHQKEPSTPSGGSVRVRARFRPYLHEWGHSVRCGREQFRSFSACGSPALRESSPPIPCVAADADRGG